MIRGDPLYLVHSQQHQQNAFVCSETIVEDQPYDQRIHIILPVNNGSIATVKHEPHRWLIQTQTKRNQQLADS